MAGIVGIIRSSKIIGGAFSLAYKEIAHRKNRRECCEVRWQSDLKMNFIVLSILLTALLLFVFSIRVLCLMLHTRLSGC